MNLTNININRNNKYPNYNRVSNNNHISFKNGAGLSGVFMLINKHDVIGTSLIDLLSMVIPRSVIDFTRNKEAGTETAIRESSSTVINASIGFSGLAVAALSGLGLKKTYGVDFKSITANKETITAFSKVFKDTVKNNPNANKEELSKQFLSKIFEHVEGLSGNVLNGDTKTWQTLKNTAQRFGEQTINTTQSIVDILIEQQKNNPKYKLNSATMSKLLTYMNLDLPSTQKLKVTLGSEILDTTGEHFLADAHALAKAFTQDNVLKTFKESADAAASKFVKDLKRLNLQKTILGLSLISAIALSVQSINRKLTKKRTGKDGFVGDPNYDKNNNAQETKKEKNPLFMPLKLLAMGAMGFYIFKTIGAKSFSDLATKVQFKGNLPTMEQIKLVYGSTILGRFFAANDTNELRESSFRDFLGYTNFLVLGDMVTRSFINWKDKSLINYAGSGNCKKFDLNWLFPEKASVKTHEEVLVNGIKDKVLTSKGVKSIKELFKNGDVTKEVTKKLSILNKAKIIGMLYSCIALGIFVPLINKYMTERKNKNNNKDNYGITFQSNLSETEKYKKQQVIENFFKYNV